MMAHLEEALESKWPVFPLLHRLQERLRGLGVAPPELDPDRTADLQRAAAILYAATLDHAKDPRPAIAAAAEALEPWARGATVRKALPFPAIGTHETVCASTRPLLLELL